MSEESYGDLTENVESEAYGVSPEHYEIAINVGVENDLLERTENGFKLKGKKGQNFANSCLHASFKEECKSLNYVYSEEGYKKFKEEKVTSPDQVLKLVLLCILRLIINEEQKSENKV